MPLLKYEKRR